MYRKQLLIGLLVWLAVMAPPPRDVLGTGYIGYIGYIEYRLITEIGSDAGMLLKQESSLQTRIRA